MNKKSKIKLLIYLGVILAVSPLFFNNLNLNANYSDNISITHENLKKEDDSLKFSKISNPIHIDDNDPSSNWTIAKNAGICTGNGTSSAPYVIEDLVIEGNSSVSCILIQNSNVYFRIENCTVFNSGDYWSHAGIKLRYVGNATLLNNNISYNNDHGIYLDHSDYNVISGNIVNNNENNGIYLYWSVENDILGNDVSYNYFDGIYLDESHYNYISGNTINNNGGDGISSPWYVNSNFNILTSNTVNNNGGSGIELSFSSYCTVSVNDANGNGNFGINLNGYDNLISGNTANDNLYGIRLDRCDESQVSQNTANFNIYSGIWVAEGYNNLVSQNDVINNDGNGISVNGYYHTISGNTVNYNENGIVLRDCDNIDILGNTIGYNDVYGIHVINSFSISITINTFNYNPVAIYLYKSEAALSTNNFNGNEVDKREFTEPPFPYGIVIAVVGIIFGLCIGGMLIARRRNIKARSISRTTSTEQYRKKIQVSDSLKRDIYSESEIKPELETTSEVKENLTRQDEKKIKVELSAEQLRSKYKYEIEKIREKVHSQNYFITLHGIDQILFQLEKFNLKEKAESQDTFFEKILEYATRICEKEEIVLINEDHVKKAFKEIYRIEPELMRKIQSVEQVEVRELEDQPTEELEEQPAGVEALEEEKIKEKKEVAQDELGQPLNINQIRSRFSKFKKEIEKIREKFHGQNMFINLEGVNEVINSIEKLNLKKRDEFRDEYLEILLKYAIMFCKEVNENLVNERHIKIAFQEIYNTEVDLIRKIQASEEISVIRPEVQPDELEVIEEEILSVPKEIPLEEVVSKEDVTYKIEELPMEQEIMPEEVAVEVKSEEPPEEIAPEPQITNCSFCGLVFDEPPTFCPQCGMIFKKK